MFEILNCNKRCAEMDLHDNDFDSFNVGKGPITNFRSYKCCKFVGTNIRYSTTKENFTQMSSCPFCYKYNKFLLPDLGSNKS